MGERFVMKLLFLSFLVTGVVAAQPVQPRMTIPAIAKDARGAVVSIIMSGKDGSPIAQGSGFLISKDGLILTNYHVVESGSSAIVKLPDGAFFAVDGLLAFDKARDVAVIKAHGEDFRTLTLGNSDQLQVGEEVVAIGSPLSLESTVSNGIISGIRTVEEEGGKFLQVTTPISPGSSGGPLFNMAGEVVGITTLYLKGGENLNFAIPINDAKRLLLSNSSKIQALPNETEPVKAQTHEADAPAQQETQQNSTKPLTKEEQPTAPAATSHRMSLWKAWDFKKKVGVGSVTLDYPVCAAVTGYSPTYGLLSHNLKESDLRKSGNMTIHFQISGCRNLHLLVDGVNLGLMGDNSLTMGDGWFFMGMPMSLWASATHLELEP